jgi:hypothetical protein
LRSTSPDGPPALTAPPSPARSAPPPSGSRHRRSTPAPEAGGLLRTPTGLRQPPQLVRRVVRSQPDRRRHGEPPSVLHDDDVDAPATVGAS